ncbi:hypothetical protein EIN_016360 [Entamoeba invadens IP1]|uniref:hypothetical protein n=1 Tax=Entamoeba invadens IP1 TaxID=370355 RepID=UPI0002C3E6F4|nr:hypothetical protein EIN_016360 [Entamoeba invadens IP1]ELP90417.1 hypothetical protein EIN_016360 [Entamoeba invadens IP1]|eukprot:XP_004257188.1 hypothetical protein EIN_016360 [Entamoeba invadens IP1]
MSKSLKYKCIVLDQDDTTVDSTPSVHYKSYQLFMSKYRKDSPIFTLEEWYKILWDVNTTQFFNDVLCLSNDEKKEIYQEWINCYTNSRIEMFPGILDFLKEYRSLGGIIIVCTHGQATVIKDFYEKYTNGAFLPDDIYGFDPTHPELCKPYPYPIECVLQKYRLTKQDIVVVDDLSHGLLMAKNAGVDSIGALYGKGHQLVADRIKELSKTTVDSVAELKSKVILLSSAL